MASFFEVFAPGDPHGQPAQDSILTLAAILWVGAVAVLLWGGWAKPFGWMAAVITLVIAAVVFGVKAILGGPPAWDLGLVTVSSQGAMVGALALLAIALVFCPPKKEIHRELAYLLPIKNKSPW